MYCHSYFSLQILIFPEAQLSPISLYTPSLGKLTHIHSLIITCPQMSSPVYISSSNLWLDLQISIFKCLWTSSPGYHKSPSNSTCSWNSLLPAFPISVDCLIILSSCMYLGSFWYLPVPIWLWTLVLVGFYGLILLILLAKNISKIHQLLFISITTILLLSLLS